jgi:hypothetical protein
LPEHPLTDVQHKTVRSAIAPILGDARISASLTSQLLAGEVVTIMDGRGDWLQVRGPDAYEGWTHAGYLMPSSGGEATWRISLGCQVRDQVGTMRSLPVGARIAPSSDVVSGTAIEAERRAYLFPGEATAIAQSAESLYAGASYLWGGVTPWGCDCSGFVQRIHGLHGIGLPRDAWQQAMAGRQVSDDASADHEPGDLLFFSDREDSRITHVGIALESHRMVHSALMRGGVAIEQLRSHDAYVTRLRAQCVEVRRVV